MIAGGDVVGIIKKGIIDPDLVADRDTFYLAHDRSAARGGGLVEFRNSDRRAGLDAAFDCRRRFGGRDRRGELVKRALLLRIAAAWVITVPLAAVLAAMFYFMIRGMLLP